jgi:RNA polymerase sigma-70 factor (ECF subfamily)
MTAAQGTESGQGENLLAAARTGDQEAFSALAEPFRSELQVHCYRMLGSFEEAEDLVQETFLRAWRKLATFEGRSTFRAWLYRIATNACLDFLERRPRLVPVSAVGEPGGSGSSIEIPWLEPYPDRLLDAMDQDQPGDTVVSKETIELAFLVAIQHLPPRQRAVLIARDVLGWSAKETASLLEASVASVNSALQRARETMKANLPAQRMEWKPSTDPSTEERALLRRYMDANDRGDTRGIAELLREDVRFSMPPDPGVFRGRDAVVASWVEGGWGSAAFGKMRSIPTRANRQPAVAAYVRKPEDTEYRSLALDVIRVEEGLITEIVTFGPKVFPPFGLPEIWEERFERLDEYLRELGGWGTKPTG